MLNGLALHQELGNEQFIGAIYSETLTDDADTLINSNSAMRMELKIVNPDGMMIRRFSRMWIEGMAINNTNSLLTAQADNMVQFDGLFKGRLEANDHIVFAQTPGQGLSVSVNKVQLGRIADDQFFPMLLRTWVGRVPLSSTYREELLKVGNVNADLRSRYDRIQPSAARVAAVTAWTQPAEPEQEKPAVAAVKPAPKPQPTPTPAPATPVIETPKVELPKLAEETPKPEPEKPAVAARPEPKEQPRPVAATPSRQEEEEEDNEPALTAQSLLARQFYVSDLLKKIRTNVKYPRRALDRGHEGGVRISVAIDRQGNIKSMSWLEETRHDTLNKEAWEAVQRSAPFPAMPDAIPGSGFEFSAPITFALPK
ncbi:TonB family protein [Cellvibrio sp. ARAG 10.3]|uniref:TonB family protein n=1 Tax=Cellvibrio sp. ARAG 10.3 TaxID=3451358 RepID=UPI003F44CCD4